MKKEMLKAKTSFQKDNRPLETTLSFSLQSFIERIKNKLFLAGRKLDLIIHPKNAGKQLELSGLPEGTELKSMPLRDSISAEIYRTKQNEPEFLNHVNLSIVRKKRKYRLLTREETMSLLSNKSGYLYPAEN